MNTGILSDLAYRLRNFTTRRFLVKLRRATHRVPVKLRTIQPGRVLVVSPHYDDETIGCGGTLLLHRDAGSVVRVVFATNCEDGIASPEVAKKVSLMRLEEARSVAEKMRFEAIKPYPFFNAISYEDQLTDKLAGELEEFEPDQIFCTFPVDAHADHQACALAVARATKRIGWRGDIFCFEVWSTCWPNAAVDISSVVEEKEALIRMYASQMEDRDYAKATIGLNRFRGLQHRIDSAEAFYVCSPDELARMTDLLNTL